MKRFKNALDKIKIASPCGANWNEMRGDDRQRHCAECKLNVYNLSDMTRREAESFLINSEGRVCVRFYQRKDGTVLTKDCPVGWQELKKRTATIAKAAFASVLGLMTGIFLYNQTQIEIALLMDQVKVETEKSDDLFPEPNAGEVGNIDEIKNSFPQKHKETLGQVVNFRPLEDEPVILWIE